MTTPLAAAVALRAHAALPSSFAIVDHRCAGLPPPFYRGPPAERHELPEASYYVAGVTAAQRDVYDEHCAARYAQRSPYHYSSADEVAAKAELGGDIWAASRWCCWPSGRVRPTRCTAPAARSPTCRS